MTQCIYCLVPSRLHREFCGSIGGRPLFLTATEMEVEEERSKSRARARARAAAADPEPAGSDPCRACGHQRADHSPADMCCPGRPDHWLPGTRLATVGLTTLR